MVYSGQAIDERTEISYFRFYRVLVVGLIRLHLIEDIT